MLLLTTTSPYPTVVSVLVTKYRASCHTHFSITATQLALVNSQAMTDANSHTKGTFMEPDTNAPRFDFMVERLPDSRDRRSRRRALQGSRMGSSVIIHKRMA